MRARFAVVFVAAMAACTARTAAPPIQHPVYQYTLPTPTGAMHPGETLTLTWRAAQSGQSERQPGKVCLCFAVIGSYANVTDLKAGPQPPARCPITGPGVVFASDVAEADQSVDATVMQDVRLPGDLAPGLYSFVQVSELGGGNATSSAGVVTVSAR